MSDQRDTRGNGLQKPEKMSTLMCLVMSTSQGRMLQSRLSLTIRHCLLALVMRKDTPRPQVLEHGLHDEVCVTQFSCQVSFPLNRAVKDEYKGFFSTTLHQKCIKFFLTL